MEMQIFVKSSPSSRCQSGDIYTLYVRPEDTVKSVKVQIRNKHGTDPLCQRLFFAGHQLRDGLLLSDYKIEDCCLLELLCRICSDCNKWVSPADYLDNALFCSYSGNGIMYEMLCRSCHDIKVNDEVIAAT